MKYAILLPILVLLGCNQTNNTPKRAPIHSAACKISTLDRTGSGILLDTGYVLTAGHVIDLDGSKKLEEPEKIVELIFYNPDIKFGGTKTITGKVLAMINNDELDISIIQPLDPTPYKSSVKLVTDQEYDKIEFGTKVFTIGCPLGRPIVRTDGTIAHPILPHLENTSISILPGNSGGGVFNLDNNCLGIIKLGLQRRHKFMFQTFKGIVIKTFHQTIPNSSNYVPANRIRIWATSENLKYTIDLPETQPKPKKAKASDVMYLIISVLVLQVITGLYVWKTRY